jgi:hypothetical protein
VGGELLNVKTVVMGALEAAQGGDDAIVDRGARHRSRSARFVERLAAGILEEHADCGQAVASMTKHDGQYRHLFGMNELLFDVALVSYDIVDSGSSGRDLAFVTKGLWIVESEMARNKREALFDFNKLILGQAENKLFVGPHVHDEADYLRVLARAAGSCSGTLYVALIPHPDEWPVSREDPIDVWRWQEGAWKSLP